MPLPFEGGVTPTMPRVSPSIVQGMLSARAAARPVDGRAFGKDRGYGVYRGAGGQLTYKGTAPRTAPRAAPRPPGGAMPAPASPPPPLGAANPVAQNPRVTFPTLIGGEYPGRGVQEFGMIGTYLNPVRNAFRGEHGGWEAPGSGPGGTWQWGDPLSTDPRLWGQAGSAGNPSLYLNPRRVGFFGGLKRKPKPRRR